MPQKREINIGDMFGESTVISILPNDSSNKRTFLLRCKCENTFVKKVFALKPGSIHLCETCLEKTQIGDKYGEWTVIDRVEKRAKESKRQYLCECSCGHRQIVLGTNLRNKNTCNSCMSCAMSKDFTGQKFGRLFIVKKVGRDKKSNNWLYECLCDCGNISYLISCTFTSGQTQSCGCLKIEATIAMNKTRTGKNNPLYGVTGDKHHSWQGGITPENKLERSEIRDKINPIIYSRDNHTCYNCNNTNCEIHAHHIFNFAAHKELRKNMFNIITLCKKCHQKYHRKYGYRNNLTQFEEFTKRRYIFHQSLLNYVEFYNYI